MPKKVIIAIFKILRINAYIFSDSPLISTGKKRTMNQAFTTTVQGTTGASC